MNKIKNWLKEHQPLIIAILILVIALKGCKSCKMERNYYYNATQYEYIIDSMKTVIDERSIDTKDLCDTIHMLRTENNTLKDIVTDLKNDREHYRNVNKELVGVTNKLSKKNTTK